MSHKEAMLSLTCEASGAIWWLFQGNSGGRPNHTVKDRIKAKRVRRIVKAVRKVGLDKLNNKFLECEITIAHKDMKYLKEIVEKQYESGNGIPSSLAEGIEDLLEAIERVEDEMAEQRLKAKKAAEPSDTKE